MHCANKPAVTKKPATNVSQLAQSHSDILGQILGDMGTQPLNTQGLGNIEYGVRVHPDVSSVIVGTRTQLHFSPSEMRTEPFKV